MKVTMSWAAKRRALYLGGVTLFILVVFGIPAFFLFYTKPTCFDGVQNQGELGIDQGGPCTRLHASQVQNTAILWSRAFEVVPGVYSVVAYVNNPNFQAGAVGVPYSFKLFDADNILVAERKGTTYLSPNSVIPVFEGGISTGERAPVRTYFEFLETPRWERVDTEIVGLEVGNRELVDEDTAPRITAVINNQSFKDIRAIDIIATIFNADNIAIGSSRTAIDVLPQQSSQTVFFTWPHSFSDVAARVEVIAEAPYRE